MNSLDQLEGFRQSVYALLGNGRDAVFDLMDAILVSRGVSSFVELSLSAVFRRRWSSVYAAIALKERTYEHQAQPLSGSKPVTVGHGSSTLAWIPEAQGSWALPFLHERITSFDSPIRLAVTQLKTTCEQLPPGAPRPLSLWDAEYGCAPFIRDTAAIACDKLIRVRPNRVLYAAPPAYSGKGRPRKHGDKFKLNDPQTWWTPDQCLEVEADALGHVQVQCWQQLHFSQSASHPMHLIRVERLTPGRTHRPLWLIWVGAVSPRSRSLVVTLSASICD